jgi:hypothetical protein
MPPDDPRAVGITSVQNRGISGRSVGRTAEENRGISGRSVGRTAEEEVLALLISKIGYPNPKKVTEPWQQILDFFSNISRNDAQKILTRLSKHKTKDDFAIYFQNWVDEPARAKLLQILQEKAHGTRAEKEIRRPDQFSTVASNSKYIDNVFQSMSLPILGGPFYFSSDKTYQPTSKNIVIIPRSMIHYQEDPLKGKVVIFLGKVHTSLDSASAEALQLSRETGDSVVGYYYGTGGYIFPTIISDTTAARITATTRNAIIEEAQYGTAAKELSWKLLWWYIGARFPIKAQSGPPSKQSTIVSDAGHIPPPSAPRFNQIPYGQTPESLGRVIGARAAEGAKQSGLLKQAGPSWINRIINAVRPLRLSQADSATVIESATIAAKYNHGPRAILADGTIVITPVMGGPKSYVIGILTDGTIRRGLAQLDYGAQYLGGFKLGNITWY